MQTDTFNLNTFHTLVNNIYDMAMDVDHWDNFLEQAATICGVEKGELANAGDAIQPTDSENLLHALRPHIRRAFRIGRQLRQAKYARNAILGVLDRLSCGVMLFSQSGKPVYANPYAKMMNHNSPLLKLDSPDHLLSSVIRASLGERPDNVKPKAFSVGCEQSRMHVVVMPLQFGEVFETQNDVPASVAFIAPADDRSRSAAGAITQLFDLSRAESRLLGALIDGMSIEEAAEHYHVSKHTLRVQLRSIFKKTNARNQADLIRRVMHLPLRIQAA